MNGIASPNNAYPVNLDLVGRSVLVVGGGPVAARKVAGLLRAGAHVTVVAPEAVAQIMEDVNVTWFSRAYQRGEAASYRLAITATNEESVNAQVAKDGEMAGVFVNSADDPQNCTFTLPAVARRGDLQIAVSTNGRSPAFARWLSRRYEGEITGGYDQLLELLAETRVRAQDDLGTSEVKGWEEALDGDLIDLVRTGRIEDARVALHEFLGLDRPGGAPVEVAVETAV